MTAIRIFDTTLRDGEQAPGFSMSEEGKLRMARALAALKVDVIEAGFAAASPGDARAIERIAGEIEGPVLASLARATPGDIMAAAKALKGAKSKRLHIFLGTSPLHREFKLKLSEAEVLRTIHEVTKGAKEDHNAIGAKFLQNWAEHAAPSTFALASRLYSRLNIADRHPPIYNVVVTLDPQNFLRILLEQQMPKGWLAGIIDRVEVTCASRPGVRRAKDPTKKTRMVKKVEKLLVVF
jgi:isopropylmalate/homocitrate/citramalate synthase